MSETRFFKPAGPQSLGTIAERVEGELDPAEAAARAIAGTAPLDRAGPDELSFIRAARHLPQLAATRAGVVLCPAKLREAVPEGTAALVVRDPQRAFMEVARLFYPQAMRPLPFGGADGVAPGATVDPSARLEPGARVEAGAFVGASAEIGAGTLVAPNAVIGPGCRIGRDCSIGPNVTVQHCLMGDRVIVHPGAAIGQDGFGFVMGQGGHEKVPQVGRVIVQDDVEIGANSTVDRGSGKDTVIGKGTKIDNLVQIAHNVEIGNHCVLAAHVGVSGSSVLQDYVVLAGKVGVADHLTIGVAAQVAGGSNVADDIPPGGRWVGSPARPVRRWMRELMALSTLASNRRSATRTRTRAPGRGNGSSGDDADGN